VRYASLDEIAGAAVLLDDNKPRWRLRRGRFSAGPAVSAMVEDHPQVVVKS